MKASPSVIEDKGSGTQLVQDLRADGVHDVARHEPKVDKVMRMHSVSSIIESGFVHVSDQAHWLPEFLHETSSFPRGKYDDQVDSTSHSTILGCA
jgi:predicted phage terminase large subunit-like protein